MKKAEWKRFILVNLLVFFGWASGIALARTDANAWIGVVTGLFGGVLIGGTSIAWDRDATVAEECRKGLFEYFTAQ